MAAAHVHERLAHGSPGDIPKERQVVHHAVLIEARLEACVDLARERRSLASCGVAERTDAFEIDPAEKWRPESRVSRVSTELIDYESNVSRLDVDYAPEVSLASQLVLPLTTPSRQCRIGSARVTERGRGANDSSIGEDDDVCVVRVCDDGDNVSIAREVLVLRAVEGPIHTAAVRKDQQRATSSRTGGQGTFRCVTSQQTRFDCRGRRRELASQR